MQSFLEDNMIDTERGINFFLEDWVEMPDEMISMKIKEGENKLAQNVWNELVEKHPKIELYPNERPKYFVNMIHELINWLQCMDDQWRLESSPIEDRKLVERMERFFEDEISPASREALRKAQSNWPY